MKNLYEIERGNGDGIFKKEKKNEKNVELLSILCFICFKFHVGT